MPQVTISAERAFEAAGIMQDVALEKGSISKVNLHLRVVAGMLRMTSVSDLGESEVRRTSVCEIPADSEQIFDVRVSSHFVKMLRTVASKFKKGNIVVDVEFLPGESKPATIKLIAGSAKKTFNGLAFGDSTEPSFEIAGDKPFSVDPKDFGKLIKTVRPFVSKETSKPICKLAFETVEGELLAIGTDGHRMVKGSLCVPTRGFELEGNGKATLSPAQAEGVEVACRLADRVELRFEKVGKSGSIFTCSTRTPEGLVASFGMVASFPSFPSWRHIARSTDDTMAHVKTTLTADGVQTLRSLCKIERTLNASVEQSRFVGPKAAVVILGVVNRDSQKRLGACTYSGFGDKQAFALVATSSLHAGKQLLAMFDPTYVEQALALFKGGVDLYLYDQLPMIARGSSGPVGIESYLMPMKGAYSEAFNVGEPFRTVSRPIDVGMLSEAVKLAKSTFEPSIRVRSDGAGLEFVSVDVATTVSTRLPWNGPRFETHVPANVIAGIVSSFPKNTLLNVSIDSSGVFEMHDQSTGITVPIAGDDKPPIDVPACNQPILTTEASQFSTCLRSILPSVSYGENRPHQEIVRIECSDGSMVMVGTDGRRLSRVIAPVQQSNAGTWVVSAVSARLLNKALSGRSVSVEVTQSKQNKEGRTWIQFAVTKGSGVECKVWAKESQHEFPRYRTLLRDRASCGIIADPKELLAALKKTTSLGTVKGNDMGVVLSKGAGLAIQSVSYKTKANVPSATFDGMPPAGQFWGPHLAEAIEPMRNATTQVRLYLGPDDDPCVIQGAVSTAAKMETFLMPRKETPHGDGYYADDAPTPVKIQEFVVDRPKLASPKKRSSKRPGSKRRSGSSQELIDVLNDFMANKTNFDWQMEGPDRIVLNWDGEPIGVITYDGRNWIVRRDAPGRSVVVHTVKKFDDDLTEWISDEIAQRSWLSARARKAATSKKPSKRYPTRASLGLGSAPWSKRALNILDNYSLRQMDDGRWEALSMLDGNVFERYEADTREEAIRLARANWGHMNFEDEAEAFGVVFPFIPFKKKAPSRKPISAKKPSPRRPSPKAPSKRPSSKRLYITDEGAFEMLASIEGKVWERKHLGGGLKLDNGFFLNLEAFKVIEEQGLAGLDIPLSDLDEKAGAIAGFAGSGYIVMPDGQIMLDGSSASKAKRQKAAKFMQVIEDE